MAPTTEELRKTAFDAEKDLNSYQAKQGLGPKSDSSKQTCCLNPLPYMCTHNCSALESGVNEMVDQRFAGAGASVKYGPGSTASGSDHRVVPEDEGGTRDDLGRYVDVPKPIFLISRSNALLSQ